MKKFSIVQLLKTILFLTWWFFTTLDLQTSLFNSHPWDSRNHKRACNRVKTFLSHSKLFLFTFTHQINFLSLKFFTSASYLNQVIFYSNSLCSTSIHQLDVFGIDGRGGGGGKQISSIVQIERSFNGNLKFISVPVINDPSRHFSFACSGIRQKFCKVRKMENWKLWSLFVTNKNHKSKFIECN